VEHDPVEIWERTRTVIAAAGFWRDTAELRADWHESRRWEPAWSADRRAAGYAGWKKAVGRTLDWVDVG
jgi:glycerol kinase